MNDKTTIHVQFKNSVTGQNKLDKYADTLERIRGIAVGLGKGLSINVGGNADKQLTSLGKHTSSLEKKFDTINKKFNAMFNIGSVILFSRAIKGLVTTFGRLTKASSSFLEDFNLFQVAFDGNTKEAEKFVNKLAEMYGLDEGWLLRTTGLFKQLANAMGIAGETGDKMSKLLTEMSIDISSLFNLDVDRSSSILQSALAGQTKPVRSIGGDITQSTLQTTLDSLNIDRQITDLSYAEKRLIIIVSLTQQLSEATGDWGRTLKLLEQYIEIYIENWAKSVKPKCSNTYCNTHGNTEIT